jgi:hypothetical protein
VHQLKKVAAEMAETNLMRKLPPGDVFWAGIKATEFSNGEKVKIGEHRYFASVKDTRYWKTRVYIVDAEVPVFTKTTKKIFKIRYTYNEKNSQELKLKPKFIYGFPSDKFLLDKDPFRQYRRNKKVIKAISQRHPFVGMKEELLGLVLGEPQTVQESTSIHGNVKQLIYESQIIHVKDGVVTGKEHR